MKSVYIVGGAGAGKSTFTAELLEGTAFGPLVDLHAVPNRKNIVTLRGHYLSRDGLYLGVQRESFPGTDGLDRASSPVVEAWLEAESSAGALPTYLVGEGATLATTRVLTSLEEYSDLLLVHLTVPPEEAVRRFAARGSNQKPSFVEATVTRSANRAREAEARGTRGMQIDTTDPIAWELAVDFCRSHLGI